MPDHHRRAPITDSELENLIAGLPKRRPDPGLRDRVLAPGRRHPRVNLRRPVVAWAVLALLLAADVAALRLQGPGSAAGTSRPPLAATAAPRDADMLALLDDAGILGGRPAILGLAAPGPLTDDTYLALRKRMLLQQERSLSNG